MNLGPGSGGSSAAGTFAGNVLRFPVSRRFLTRFYAIATRICGNCLRDGAEQSGDIAGEFARTGGIFATASAFTCSSDQTYLSPVAVMAPKTQTRFVPPRPRLRRAPFWVTWTGLGGAPSRRFKTKFNGPGRGWCANFALILTRAGGPGFLRLSPARGRHRSPPATPGAPPTGRPWT